MAFPLIELPAPVRGPIPADAFNSRPSSARISTGGSTPSDADAPPSPAHQAERHGVSDCIYRRLLSGTVNTPRRLETRQSGSVRYKKRRNVHGSVLAESEPNSALAMAGCIAFNSTWRRENSRSPTVQPLPARSGALNAPPDNLAISYRKAREAFKQRAARPTSVLLYCGRRGRVLSVLAFLQSQPERTESVGQVLHGTRCSAAAVFLRNQRTSK